MDNCVAPILAYVLLMFFLLFCNLFIFSQHFDKQKVGKKVKKEKIF